MARKRTTELRLFRRHTSDPKSGKSRCSKGFLPNTSPDGRCDCFLHVSGTLDGKAIRQSTGTRSITKARAMAVKATETGTWPDSAYTETDKTAAGAPAGKDLIEAVTDFIKDAESERGRNLRASTMIKYRTVFTKPRGLLDFANQKGVTTLEQITVPFLRDFRDTWRTGPRATANNVARLRTFFHFCVANDWLPKNPASQLRPPKKIDKVQKLPFSDLEMKTMVEGARRAALHAQQTINNFELETFIFTMRYSGLRISDVAMLQRSRLVNDDLFLYAKKGDASQKVYTPLPAWLADMLRQIKLKGEKGYFFCSESERVETQVELWYKRLRLVWDYCRERGLFGERDAVPTSHRFRHTFAVDLLVRGVSVEDVADLLGHSSADITREHYSAWIPERQRRLASAVRAAHEASEAARDSA